MGFCSSQVSMSGDICYRDIVLERPHNEGVCFRQPNHFGLLSKFLSTLEEVLTWSVSSLLELKINTEAWGFWLLSQPTHPHISTGIHTVF